MVKHWTSSNDQHCVKNASTTHEKRHDRALSLPHITIHTNRKKTHEHLYLARNGSPYIRINASISEYIRLTNKLSSWGTAWKIETLWFGNLQVISCCEEWNLQCTRHGRYLQMRWLYQTTLEGLVDKLWSAPKVTNAFPIITTYSILHYANYHFLHQFSYLLDMSLFYINDFFWYYNWFVLVIII